MPEGQQGGSVPEMPLDDYAAFEAHMQPGRQQEPAAEEEIPAAAEQEPQAETEPESEPEEGQEEPGQKGKGVQKRIDKLTRKVGDVERENAELKRRLEERPQESRPAQNNAPPQKQAAGEGEPQLENFDSYQEYYKALVDHRLDQREKTKAAATEQQTALEAWETKQKSARERHADYDEALESVEIPNTPALPAIREALSDSEHGAELLYHLAKHPLEAKRIAALSPIAAVRELGKLEVQISAAAAPDKPQPRKETNAPPPPRRVDGRFASTKALDDPELPYEEFEKRMNAKQRR